MREAKRGCMYSVIRCDVVGCAAPGAGTGALDRTYAPRAVALGYNLT